MICYRLMALDLFLLIDGRGSMIWLSLSQAGISKERSGLIASPYNADDQRVLWAEGKKMAGRGSVVRKGRAPRSVIIATGRGNWITR